MRVFFQHVILTILLFYTNSVLGQEDSTSYAYFSNGVYTQFHGVQSIRPVYGGTRILAEIPDSWDEAQQGAFRYACDLWEEVLPSTFPIRIRVQTQSLNSNISEGSVLSRVSPVSLNVGIYSTASYKPQISAVTFMEMVGKYQSQR